MNNCTFYYSNGYCTILKTQECKGCKFRKTQEEFVAAQKRVDERLESKGLCRVISHNRYGENVMTVKEIE